MSKIDVRVSIPDRNFETTVNAARKVGLAVTQSFDVLGVALGSIEEKALSELRSVPGVGSVERQQEYSIPTPVEGRR